MSSGEKKKMVKKKKMKTHAGEEKQTFWASQHLFWTNLDFC